MGLFRSRKRSEGGAALAEPSQRGGDDRPLDAIFAEIEDLQAANRSNPDRERQRRLVRLRHRAGIKLLEQAGPRPAQPSPASDQLPVREPGALPGISPDELTPELLRAGMLRDGCLLVRGLVAPDRARRLAEDIDRAFLERAALEEGRRVKDPIYEEFEPEPPFTLGYRGWVKDSGGVLGADSPKLMSDLIEVFQDVGLDQVIPAYLGERPAISMDKSTLRKSEPTAGGAWHQDGAFMGDVRALNVWLSLSHCGDDAPGLDIVPRRFDQTVPTGTEDATFDWSVAPAIARREAGEEGPVRPIFEPGDAVLFDELCLHSTALSPSMTKTRYAVECWFFGPSAYPEDYVPLAF